MTSLPSIPAGSDARLSLATWLRELIRLQPSSGVFAGLERRLQPVEVQAQPCL